MNYPTFDSSGYPTAETLDAIENWPYDDWDNLMPFVKEAFESDFVYGWFDNKVGRISDPSDDDGRWWCCATGGWSGCEDVIAALQGNTIFWFCCWHASTRGGYHEFHVPRSTS